MDERACGSVFGSSGATAMAAIPAGLLVGLLLAVGTKNSAWQLGLLLMLSTTVGLRGILTP